MTLKRDRWIARARVAAPLLAVAAGAAIAVLLARSGELPEPELDGPPPRAVEVHVAQPEVLRLDVESQGTVQPETVTTLVARVGGEVIALGPSLAPGGFFAKGELLLSIDDADYEIAVTQARARLAQAEHAMAVEEKEAKLAIDEWKRVMGDVEPDPLAAHVPQLAAATANLEAAQATLRRARLDRERTKVRAPYTGRVRRRIVDLGQVVVPGQALAVVHGTGRAEVRLPLSDASLAYLDLPPELGRGRAVGPPVVLAAAFAGRELEWRGRIARIIDEVDPRTQMVHLVAVIDDPYARREGSSHPPLPAGVFVRARIEGRRVAGVVALPRIALRAGNRVWIVDSQSRLRSRDVHVLKTERKRVLIDQGLAAGDRVCLTAIEAFVENMPVRVDETSERR